MTADIKVAFLVKNHHY